MRSLLDRVALWGNLVRFSHSVFAIPFAVIMLFAVMRTYSVTSDQLLLLALCVVSARFAAMAFNRVVDSHIDARNERTKSREIPTGKISIQEGWMLVVVAASVFVAASYGLGEHCGVLSFPVLGVLFGYSFFKRFSSLCHLVLGAALACAPGGVWYALTATWSWQPVSLMISVALWVAGFDILYACQDAEFDRMSGLKSIPSIFGNSAARLISALFHLGSIAFLAHFGMAFEFGWWFWCGVIVFAALIGSQHLAVLQRGFGAIDQIFFVRNGVASVVLMGFVAIDQILWPLLVTR